MNTSTLMLHEIIRPFIGWYGANTVPLFYERLREIIDKIEKLEL